MAGSGAQGFQRRQHHGVRLFVRRFRLHRRLGPCELVITHDGPSNPARFDLIIIVPFLGDGVDNAVPGYEGAIDLSARKQP
jgi:hypothetical protein